MAKYDVNIDLANQAKKEMLGLVGQGSSRVMNRVGAFASLYDFTSMGISEPVLVLKTEEPGSKQLIAMQYDLIENVCHDMINHLVNDCIVMGAAPLTVQDAVICGKLDKSIVTRIVKAISEACRNNSCVLTGGETSEQPGVIADGTYILTSSIVGVVEKKDIIDGSKIREGDTVLALESSGIHTNGYTLVRRIMREKPEILDVKIGDMPFIDAILLPHRAYYESLKGLFGKGLISGLAHITGGGIKENLDRILPENVDAEIDLAKYETLEIFKVLKKYGEVSPEEMLRTFNLGVGIALVAPEENKGAIIEHLESMNVHTFEIGKIVKGEGRVICKGEIEW